MPKLDGRRWDGGVNVSEMARSGERERERSLGDDHAFRAAVSSCGRHLTVRNSLERANDNKIRDIPLREGIAV